MAVVEQTVAGLKRSKDGRPYITDPSTGRKVLYTRASTFARTLSDGAALEAWKLRMAYQGLTQEPVLLGAADREVIDMRIATAMDLAGANEGANWGTTLHDLTDIVDRGGSLSGIVIPGDLLDGLDRYVEVTKRFAPVEIERFVVNDLWHCAGTFDRIFRLPDGRLVMADLKTGGSIRMLEHGIQLAAYAKAWFYDVQSETRTLPVDVDPHLGLVVHVPKDRTWGDPELIWVDMQEAVRMADLARTVRSARSGLARLKAPEPIVGSGE